MKKMLATAIGIVIAIFEADAQVVCKEVYEKFPPGIVARVYEITKNRPLSQSLQLKLAGRIMSSDSLVAAAVIQGKRRGEIDSLRHNSDEMLTMLMERMDAGYTDSEAERFASMAISGEMKIIKQMYSPDTLLYGKIRAIQFNKYKTLFHSYLLNRYEGEKAAATTEQALQFYDSAAYTVSVQLCNKKYLEDYIQQLRMIKPGIPDSVIVNMSKSYYMQVAKNKYAASGPVLLNIMQRYYPDTSITARLYKAELERQASFLSSAGKHQAIGQYITNSAFESIAQLVKEKNFRQVLLEYTYGSGSMLKDSLITSSNRYFDSVIEATMIKDGSLLSESQFAIALKYKNALKLAPELSDILVGHALYLERTRDSIMAHEPYARVDFKAYEARYMNQLLTEDQYTQVLNIKNNSQAKSDAENDWTEMEKRGIAFGLNKQETTGQLYRYYLLKWNAYYRMADNTAMQEANLQLLRQEQPKALFKLAAARKASRTENVGTGAQVKW